MGGCIERTDGRDGDDTTLQQAYDNSGAVVPQIQLSAANGPIIVRGEGATANILQLQDDAGNDEFIFTRLGNLTMGAATPTLTMGDGTGGPIISLGKADAFTAFPFNLSVGDPGVGANLRWNFQFGTNEDLRWHRFDVLGVAVDVPMTIEFATGNIQIDNDLIMDGSGVGSTGELDLASDDASLQVGNALGTPRIDVNHLPAETGILAFRQVNDIDTTGDKILVHGTGTDALIIQDFDGAVFDDLMTFTTTIVSNVAHNFDAAVTMDTTLGVTGNTTLSGSLTVDVGAASVRFGDGSSGPNLTLRKADASANSIRFEVGSDLRGRIQQDSNEDFRFEMFDAVPALTSTTFWRNADGDWEFPNNVDVGNNLVVTGGANIEGTVDFGDATDSVLFNIQKSAAGSGQIQFRITTSGNTSGDKVLIHQTDESFQILNHNGATFDTLVTFTTLFTCNAIANFDAAVTMDTTLGVVGDTTLESDLTLDAATGNGDITMAGEMDGAGGRAWGTRTNAAGGALAIGPGDAHIEFSSNGGGAVAMTETMTEGQMVTLVMTAFDTDDYTLAVGGGTLTFNAANEAATIVLDSSVVRVVGLANATIV
jgi:hypothetical protein